MTDKFNSFAKILEMLEAPQDELAEAVIEIANKCDEANQAHAVNYWAVAMLLMDKGIITSEEYQQYRLKAQSEVEQAFALKRDMALQDKQLETEE